MERGSVWVSDQDPSLMCKCAWCLPPSKPEVIPPIPEGMRGYSDGICTTHYEDLIQRIRRKEVK